MQYTGAQLAPHFLKSAPFAGFGFSLQLSSKKFPRFPSQVDCQLKRKKGRRPFPADSLLLSSETHSQYLLKNHQDFQIAPALRFSGIPSVNLFSVVSANLRLSFSAHFVFWKALKPTAEIPPESCYLLCVPKHLPGDTKRL